MKTKWIAMIAAAAVLSSLVVTLGQTPKSKATKEFMRQKLEHSQKVLEGIALEDYQMIIANSQKLSAMSQAADWRIFENPDYVQLSASFRKNVDALTKAAKDNNLDGTVLAYMRVTMSCVDCHKFVRAKNVASLR